MIYPYNDFSGGDKVKKILSLLLVVVICCTLSAASEKSQQIITAVRNNDSYSFKHLVEEDPEGVLTISSYGSAVNIFKYVIDYGNSDLMQILLDAGVDCNATFSYWGSETTPLEYAFENNKTWAVSVLMSVSDKSAYSEDNTLMYSAVSSGSIELVKALVNSGFSINSVFLSWSTPYTALSYAVYTGKTDLVNELLEIDGIDLDCIGSSYPALYYAIYKDNESLVSTLVENGAQPGRTFSYYSTIYNCLSYAIHEEKSFAIISKLIIDGDDTALKAENCSKSPLVCAVENNDLTVVDALVKAGADVNTTFDYYGKVHNALTYAVYNKCRETVIDALLSSPTIDKNFKGCDVSPYYYALSNRNPAVLQSLLDAGINQNKTFTVYSTKYSPLSYAVSESMDSTFVDPLIEASGTDLNGRGSAYPPIYYAIYNNDAAVLQKLIDAGCNVNKTFKRYDKVYTPLGYASSSYSVSNDIKEMLTKAGASFVPVDESVPFRDIVDSADVEKLNAARETSDINEIFEVDSTEYSLLTYACYKNVDTDFLKAILAFDELEIDNEECPVSAMAYVMVNGNADNLRALIDAGVNPNLKFTYSGSDYAPLEYAVRNGLSELIEVLLGYDGIDLYEETSDSSAMCYIVSHSNITLLNRFIEAGFDINHLISDEHNVLTYAIYSEEPVSFIREILAIDGVDVNCPDTSYSPLYWSLYTNKLSTLRLLLESGADVNGEMSYYSSSVNAIGYAILTEKRMSFINSLINAEGADINAPDMDYPCVMAAVSAGDLEALDALIEAGADVNVRMLYYSTPISALEYAVEKKGRLSIIEAIVNAPLFDRNDTDSIGKACADAIENDDEEIVEYFVNSGLNLSYKVSVYSKNYNLYEYAVYKECSEEITDLLKDLF